MGWLSICSVFLQSNSNLLNFEVRESGRERGGGRVVVRWLRSWLAEQEVRIRFPVSPLEFQRLVISCFQVTIWLTYRWRDVNPQSRGGGG